MRIVLGIIIVAVVLLAMALEIQSLLEPSKRHVVTAAREGVESTDEDTSGEPPGGGA